jgi:hypothetical protein
VLIVFAHSTVDNRFKYRKVSKTQIGVLLPSVDWVHLCKPASLGSNPRNHPGIDQELFGDKQHKESTSYNVVPHVPNTK